MARIESGHMPDTVVGSSGTGHFYTSGTWTTAQVSLNDLFWFSSVTAPDGTELTVTASDPGQGLVSVSGTPATEGFTAFWLRVGDGTNGASWLSSLRGYTVAGTAPAATLLDVLTSTTTSLDAQVLPRGDDGSTWVLVRNRTSASSVSFDYRGTPYTLPALTDTLGGTTRAGVAILRLDPDGAVLGVSWACVKQSDTTSTSAPGLFGHVGEDGALYIELDAPHPKVLGFVTVDADGTTSHQPTSRNSGNSRDRLWARLGTAGAWSWATVWSAFNSSNWSSAYDNGSSMGQTGGVFSVRLPVRHASGASQTIHGSTNWVSKTNQSYGTAYLDADTGLLLWVIHSSASSTTTAIDQWHVWPDGTNGIQNNDAGPAIKITYEDTGATNTLGSVSVGDRMLVSAAGSIQNLGAYDAEHPNADTAPALHQTHNAGGSIATAGATWVNHTFAPAAETRVLAYRRDFQADSMPRGIVVAGGGTMLGDPSASDGVDLVAVSRCPVGQTNQIHDLAEVVRYDDPADRPAAATGAVEVLVADSATPWSQPHAWAYDNAADPVVLPHAVHNRQIYGSIRTAAVFGSSHTIELGPVGTDSVTVPSGSHAAVIFILSEQGRWGYLNGVEGAEDPTPTGDPDNPAKPYLADTTWPDTWDDDAAKIVGTVDEDSTVTATFSYIDPEDDPGATSTLMLWDPVARQWFTTPVEGLATQTRDVPGLGTFTIKQHGDPDNPPEGDPNHIALHNAKVTLALAADHFGQWPSLGAVLQIVRSDGTVQNSVVTVLDLTVAAVYDRLDDPEQTGPVEMAEDGGSATVVLTATDRDAMYGPSVKPVTAQLDATGDPEDPAYAPGQSITVWGPDPEDPEGPDVVAGTMTMGSVTQPSDGLWRFAVDFTPEPHWYGTAVGHLQANDGGDGLIDGDPGDTAWVTVSVEVLAVPDPPSAVSLTMPTIDEDLGPSVGTATWSDPDSDGGTLELSWSGDPGAVDWDTELMVGPDGRLEMDPDTDNDGTDRSVQVTYQPAGNLYGTVTFYSRVRDPETLDGAGGPIPIFGPVTAHTVTINPVADRPTRPQPDRMPTIESGEEIAQRTFSSTDVDSPTVALEVSVPGSGVWGTTATLPGGETVTVLDPGQRAEMDSRITVTQPPGGSAAGRYEFLLRAVDDGGLDSPVQRVVGHVSPASLTAGLVRVSWTASTITRTEVGAVLLEGLQATDSLTGPGQASGALPLDQAKRIAASQGVSLHELLEPGTVELHVSSGGTKVFAGPITEAVLDPASATIALSAQGLGAYLGRRQIEGTAAVSFSNVEETTIMTDLLATEQAKDYGQLGFTTDVVPTGNTRTIDFEPGTTLAEAYEALRELLDGAEWWVDADGVLRAASRRGSDLRGQVVLTEASTLLDDRLTWETLTTVAEVDGAAEGIYGKSSDDAAALARYGRHNARFSAAQLGTNAECSSLATQHRAGHDYAERTFSLVHHAQPGGRVGAFDYGVGDAVTLQVETPAGLVTQDVRIINRSVSQAEGTDAWIIRCEVELIGPDGTIRKARSRHDPAVYDLLLGD